MKAKWQCIALKHRLLALQAIVPDTSAVEVVLYASSVRYLMVVLRDTENGAADEALISLKPNAQALEAAYTGGQLNGVIVTAQGE